MTSCPRLFEAEAMRDGRLGDTERASFERHVTMCAACSHEVETLNELGAGLGEEGATPDELHVRRERTRLLAAFDRALVTPKRSVDARLLLWPAIATAIVVGVFVFWRARPVAQQTVIASNAEVHANETAVWSKRTEDDREKVVLERGSLWIHVTHAVDKRPILVVLPDGELEDTGTTFSVSAENGHTTRVVVDEGSVVLRLRGHEAVSVAAGGTWSADPRPAAASSTASSSTAASSTAAPPTTELALVAPSASPRGPLPSASADPPRSSVEFRAAMAALDRGENDQAATAFASFIAKHPQDPRAEDAAYMRAIAFQRMGDATRMKEAAREYLRRYPAGFRRAEVEILSH